MSSDDDEVIVQGNPLNVEEVGVADLDETSEGRSNSVPPEAAGNPLYKYMEEVGVADLDEISVAKPNAAPPEAMELLPDGFVASAVVPEHVHRLLKTIFNSHLLFDDDYNFVMSCVPDRTVKANRYRRGWAAVTAAAAVNVGVVAINQYLVSNLLRNLSVIPGCLVTVGSAGYVGKLIFDSYSEKRVEKDMENHVKIMQKFYKLLQRIISDIRDIDVISRGSGLRNQPPEAHDPKVFVPLAKFRIAIVTTLIDINSAMSCGFHSLKELLPESIKQTDFAISSTRSLIFENMEFIETRMSASDLN